MEGIGHLARTDLEGAIDSGRLMRALMRKAQEAGVLMRFNADVERIEEERSGVRIVLRDRDEVLCERVLVATNGFTPALLPELDVVPARSQALITAPIPGLRLRGTFHMHEGFYFFRDCAGGVLLGGGRHLDLEGERTMHEGLTPLVQGDLERLLREVVRPSVHHRQPLLRHLGFRKPQQIAFSGAHRRKGGGGRAHGWHGHGHRLTRGARAVEPIDWPTESRA